MKMKLWMVSLVLTFGFGMVQQGWAAGERANYIVKLKPSISSFSVLQNYAHLSIANHYEEIWSGFAANLNEADLVALQNDPRVEKVFANQEVYLDQMITQRDATWGLGRIDQRNSDPDREYQFTHTGKGITVYVIDTGINIAHQEFQGRASIAANFIPVTGKDGGDCHGHGSHVAGIIGGVHFGVAKKVKLVGLRALDCEGRGTLADVLEAVDWVAKNAAPRSVVNISIGTQASLELDKAIEALWKKGITFVVSAGNAGTDACLQSPARATEALTVGATERGDGRAWYSNEGRCVDIFAPGTDILSAHMGKKDSTKILSGTSMATPFVSGVMALMLEQYPNESVSNVRKTMLKSATQGVVTGTKSVNNHVVYSLGKR